MYQISYSDHSKLEKLLKTDVNVEDYADLNPIYYYGTIETPLSIYFFKNQEYKRSIYSLFFGDKLSNENKDQYLSFPIVHHQLKNIIEIYGKKTENNEWLIDPKHFEVGKNTKNWSNKLDAIISKSKRELGIHNDEVIKAKIESMIISNEFSNNETQLAPSDSSNSIVGILYLILPSHYIGGGIVIKSVKEQTKESKSSIQLENHNPSDLCYITVSKDSLYQFEPITEGYRVMLKLSLNKTNKRFLDESNNTHDQLSNKKHNNNHNNHNNISNSNDCNSNDDINNSNGNSNSSNSNNNSNSTQKESNNYKILDNNKKKVTGVLKHIHSILDEVESSLDSVKSNYLIYGLPNSDDSSKSEETIVLNNLLAARNAEQKVDKFGIYLGELLIKVEHSGLFRNNRGTTKTFISTKIEKIENRISNIKDLSGNPFNKDCLATEELSELLPKNCLVGLKTLEKIDDLEEKKQILVFKKRVILINQPKKKIYND